MIVFFFLVCNYGSKIECYKVARKRSRGGRAKGGGGGSFLVREFSFESGKIDVLRENRGKLKL